MAALKFVVKYIVWDFAREMAVSVEELGPCAAKRGAEGLRVFDLKLIPAPWVHSFKSAFNSLNDPGTNLPLTDSQRAAAAVGSG